MKPYATKKLMITVGAAALLFSSPLWVAQPQVTVQAAAVKSTQPQLSKLAQKTVDRLNKHYPELKNAEKTISRNTQERDVFHIQFRIFSNKERTEVSLYADAKIDANNGMLLFFSAHDIPKKKPTARPTEAMGKEKAPSILKDFIGDAIKQYQIDEVTVDGEGAEAVANVRFVRVVNQIPVKDDLYVVGINGVGELDYINAGNTTGLQMDASKFAAPSGVKNPDEFGKQLEDMLHLSYEQKARDISAGFRPVYSLNFSGYLDARSGAEVESGWTKKNKYGKPIPITPGNQRVFAKTNEEIATALSTFIPLPEGIEFKLTKGAPVLEGEKEYDAVVGNKKFSVRTVDDQIAYFHVLENPPKQKVITEAAAEEKAVVFLQPFVDAEVTELVPQMELVPQTINREAGKQTFLFSPVHQGIKVEGQGYSVKVDMHTGDIVSASLPVTTGKLSYDDASNVVGPEQAVQALLKANPLTLRYVFPSLNGRYQGTPVLVYEPKERNGKVDAVTGQFIK
ncbi:MULTISPECIES: hypothetical protein [Brevibacillus]|uniref:hypothetical protein n=1 Tax=Brevibacillus TaxID=55080 RepID=UPI000D107B0F|nr:MULTISPECIES: hypothetical protein [Brevibacillus]MED1945878.1 hypothetical protein [Brevibacillus formosus]MED2001168.1 hypothetical protein [Brevibacillus formosus]MED2085221.1 hypothetical protein [Brevibacillus formosus]PSK11833.1 hypothetical protein C7R94_25205 [Brevibacillus sp. NRRL NRS-603]